MRLYTAFAVAALLAFTAAAHADVLVQYTLQGTSEGYNPVTPTSGISFTTTDTGYATYDVTTDTFLIFSVASSTATAGAFDGDLYVGTSFDHGRMSTSDLVLQPNLGCSDEFYFCMAVYGSYPGGGFSYFFDEEPYMVFFDAGGDPNIPAYDRGYLNGAGTLTQVAAAPEPSAFVLLGTGLLGVAGIVRKRFAPNGGGITGPEPAFI